MMWHESVIVQQSRIQAPTWARKKMQQSGMALRFENKNENGKQDDKHDDGDGAPCKSRDRQGQHAVARRSKKVEPSLTYRSPSPCARRSRVADEHRANARPSGQPGDRCPRAAHDGRQARRRFGATGGAAGRWMTRGFAVASLALQRASPNISLIRFGTIALRDHRTFHNLLLLLKHVGVAHVPVRLVVLIVAIRFLEAAGCGTREWIES